MVEFLSAPEHGMLLMPSGYAAMLDLSELLNHIGSVASMVGPAWALHQPVDWASAVALGVSPLGPLYRGVLNSHVNGNRALLQVHTTFPSIGSGGADWVI